MNSAWEDYRWTGLPHLQGTKHTDVCVIGLGGSGLSAIDALLDHGVNVIGIDAAQVAGGAAGANGGFLLAGTARFYHHMRSALGSEKARQLYLLTVDEIDHMQAQMPDVVRRVGSLRIAMDDEELADCETQYTVMQQDGLSVENYTGPEGKGLLIPTDGVFNPLLRCRRLAEQCMQRGAQLFENSEALAIRSGMVRTAQGVVVCRHIVATIDGKLDSIFPALKQRVRTARLQMLSTVPTNEVNIARAVYARWGYEYWQQLPDHRVLLGGFRDQAMEPEWTNSTETTELIQNRLAIFLREHLKVNAAIEHRWAASVGYTANGMPLIEEVEANVWAVGGYNGTGNIVGALCGRDVAHRIVGKPTPIMTCLGTGIM
jgi:glycine/D-amino acid oxidase-like deaminating enzyme